MMMSAAAAGAAAARSLPTAGGGSLPGIPGDAAPGKHPKGWHREEILHHLRFPLLLFFSPAPLPGRRRGGGGRVVNF